MLQSSFIDFYLKSLDTRHGGFLDSLNPGERGSDGCGRPVGFAPAPTRVAVFQLRQFWFFSTLASRGLGGSAVRAAADHGFEYLRSHLWDGASGGVPILVGADGAVLDGRKHVYVQTMALHALASYYSVARTDDSLATLDDCWAVIEQRSHDREHGGYIELFHSDWTPIDDPQIKYIAPGGQKSYGVHMHILEAFTALYLVQPTPLLRQRIEELLTLFADTFPARTGNRCLERFERDWSIANSPVNERVSFGHELEAVWFVLDAAAVIGAPEAQPLARARAVVDSCMLHGYDREHGGFFHTGPPGVPATDTRKVGWVQAEAMNCLLTLFQRTRDARDYAAFLETLRFTGRELIVPEGGSWVRTRADGSRARDATRTGYWEGGYHMGRALLLCSEILDALAREETPGSARA